MQLHELIQSLRACLHEILRRRDFDNDPSIPHVAVPLASSIAAKCREVGIETPLLDKFISDPHALKLNSQPGSPGRLTIGDIDSELARIESESASGGS